MADRNGWHPEDFPTVLYPGPASDEATAEPDYFADLNLDQVVARLAAGREEYRLEPFFHASQRDVETVRYRHEVVRDLRDEQIMASVRRFAGRMRRTRTYLAQANDRRYHFEQERWFLDAATSYCGSVRTLGEELASLDVTSRGLLSLLGYLEGYLASDAFASLETDAHAVVTALGEVVYAVRVNGPRVTVSGYGGEPDYSAEVGQTFARFKQEAVQSYLVELRDGPQLNHVEGRILDLVAQLNPDAFGALDAFCRRHVGFPEPTIVRFDREVQFYVAYLELIEPLERAGLRFCFPSVSARSRQTSASETFDLALALKLISEQETVVCNDFELRGAERFFVVSGPNNGGKTTFARMFGQLHHLAGLGLPVPGRAARLFLPDRIFTHFEREEDIETLRGKLDDELVRVRGILEQATPESVVVMNESFGSTTLSDALFIGTEVMQALLELDLLGVYVTFVDELASLSDATVSIVSTVVPENPAVRTFRLVRRPADGRAYAWAIAEKYGLTYELLRERVVS
jgi:hypothetical protein